jgi:acyl-CoA thioester hydrolase
MSESVLPSEKRPFLVELDWAVKTYDVDFAGVVSNIVYVRWLEDLRIAMLDPRWPLHEQIAAGTAPVVLQTTIDYRQPLRLGDRAIGRMWLANLENVRWQVSAEIVNAAMTQGAHPVVAIGKQMGTFIDMQRQRPIRIPAALKQQYDEASM